MVVVLSVAVVVFCKIQKIMVAVVVVEVGRIVDDIVDIVDIVVDDNTEYMDTVQERKNNHIGLDDEVEDVHKKMAVAEDNMDGCLHKDNDKMVELIDLVELLDDEVDC